MNAPQSTVGPDGLRAARAAAERFLGAVVRGDEAAARSLLVVRKGETVDFKTMHESTAGFTLGEPTAERDGVLVTATIEAKPGRDVPPSLPMVLVASDGAYKVDMAASMKRLLGGIDLEAMVKEMATGLGDALSGAMKGVGEALSSMGSGDGASDAPPEGGPDRPKPASKPRKKRGG